MLPPKAPRKTKEIFFVRGAAFSPCFFRPSPPLPRCPRECSPTKPVPLTVSNDTRVRMDGLVKIMDMVLPANGLKLSSRAASLALTVLAVSSTASRRSRGQSSMCRKWDWAGLAGGATPAAVGGAEEDDATSTARGAASGRPPPGRPCAGAGAGDAAPPTRPCRTRAADMVGPCLCAHRAAGPGAKGLVLGGGAERERKIGRLSLATTTQTVKKNFSVSPTDPPTGPRLRTDTHMKESWPLVGLSTLHTLPRTHTHALSLPQ